MMDNKTITITTNLFKLEIYWNGKAVSAQLAIFIGLLAVSVFAQEQDIVNFMLVILFIDIVAVLYMLFKGANIDVVNEDGTKVEKSVMQTKVDNTTTGQQSEQEVKKPGPKPSGTINNKVPIPNPTTQQAPNPIPPQPVQQPVVETPPQPPMEEPKVKSIDDLSPEEWDDLFNMD